MGLGPARQAVAVAEPLAVGDRLVFCERSMPAARTNLRRICAELRALTEPESISADLAAAHHAALEAPSYSTMLGAVYVSCASRGGPHFGAPSAEAQLIRHTLGDVPMVDFFAPGEIAHQQLHGYSGVLVVFTDQVPNQGQDGATA